MSTNGSYSSGLAVPVPYEALPDHFAPLLKSAVEVVAIDALRPADSPRLTGENLEHTQVLAQLDAVLPPILVHRPTMRVIDGMHRFRAAVLNGQTTIEARFFDGPEELVFAIGVIANKAHGLPLSMTEREVAACRILASHGHWP